MGFGAKWWGGEGVGPSPGTQGPFGFNFQGKE